MLTSRQRIGARAGANLFSMRLFSRLPIDFVSALPVTLLNSRVVSKQRILALMLVETSTSVTFAGGAERG